MTRDRCFVAAMLAATALLALLQPAAALAQPTPAEPAPNTQTTPPEKIEPGPPTDGSQGNGTLGEQLDQSHGVIKPPEGVDPGLVQPPPVPPANTPMPVIPPPGTPQNQPNVQPK
ncbi:hypothetical protein [Benzoatithermus flavus]|uniref:Uncharacterized protein n=1 Tax=Benzoatithermus flavus TaxID=3108223 RepID=A0ABU8XKW2_9PROT